MQIFIVAVIVAAAVALAAKRLWRQFSGKSQGCGCGCEGCNRGCEECNSGCDSCRKKQNATSENLKQ